MATKQDTILVNKPSTSFSTTSSIASATSASSTRSGGSRLLFGEIDLTSDRSSESYASVCNLVLCDSSTLLKFWLEDKCRDTFLSYLPKSDLANLRLACHDFSVRAAPALFSELSLTFKTNTFTKPSKLAALERLGFHVRSLRFALPHTAEMFLPPLVEPETGAELSFTYAPRVSEPSARRPKYGDIGTTAILTRQYPPLFHAATNVSAFVRAFSALVNLKHLIVSCPGYDDTQRYRRSVVDYALISLRIAVEKNCLNVLDTLTLSPIHPGGLIYLSPLGLGASPRSASRWSRTRNLTIVMNHLSSGDAKHEPEQSKLLRNYVSSFRDLSTLRFCWAGRRGPLPLQHPAVLPTPGVPSRTVHRPVFPRIKCIGVEHITASATEISMLVASHKDTMEELDLQDVHLTDGTWDEALEPLTKLAGHHTTSETANIPIMLSLTTCGPRSPAPFERVGLGPHRIDGGSRSFGMSKWLSSKAKKPTTAQRMKDSLLECEEQLRKVLRASVFTWR